VSAPPGGRTNDPTTKHGYTLTELLAPAGATSEAHAINDHGHVVGTITSRNGKARATLWKNGTTTDLGTLPGHDESHVVAINNAGDVVGYSCSADDECKAWLWHDGERTELDTLGGTTQAYGINEHGQIVGESIVPVPKPLYVEKFPHAFLWEDGALTDLGGDFEDPITIARAINDAGQIVGYSHCGCRATPGPRAFLWDDETVTYLGTFGGSLSRAFDLNDRGHVVGEAERLSSRSGQVVASMQAFLWRDGRLINLGTLGGADGSARAINDAGQVVGWSTTASGEKHAFLWQNGTLHDLNDLVSHATGWVLQEASAINTAGAIAGSGEHHGRTCAYSLAPSP